MQNVYIVLGYRFPAYNSSEVSGALIDTETVIFFNISFFFFFFFQYFFYVSNKFKLYSYSY